MEDVLFITGLRIFNNRCYQQMARNGMFAIILLTLHSTELHNKSNYVSVIVNYQTMRIFITHFWKNETAIS